MTFFSLVVGSFRASSIFQKYDFLTPCMTVLPFETSEESKAVAVANAPVPDACWNLRIFKRSSLPYVFRAVWLCVLRVVFARCIWQIAFCFVKNVTFCLQNEVL